MQPETLISRLSRALAEGKEKGHGGLILVKLGRPVQLRDQFGYRGYFDLRKQVDAVQMKAAGAGAKSAWIDFATSMVLLSTGDAKAVAREVFSALSQHEFALGDETLVISVSISACGFDHRFTSVDEMLLALAHRVEHIESIGGNDVGVIKPGVSASQALDSDEHMLGLLMESLRTDSMKVVFQPLLATSGDESVQNYQMLPRLKGSDGKLIPAAEFLPSARDAALLPVIDRWMVIHAIRLLRGPLKEQSLRLFVNQSDALLADAERRTWLESQLEKSPAVRNRLVLEVRIDDAMAHLKSVNVLMTIVRNFEIGICFSRVDEHSRWDLLVNELRCDYVRMSASFVSRLSKQRELEERFMTLSRPVRDIGTQIIMPMIEDPQTAASMWRSGADFMQGNMIQAPEDTIAI